MPQTFPAIDHAMQTAVEGGVFPGAVLAVRHAGNLLYHRAFGFTAGVDGPVTSTKIKYDLASLTKVLATTTALVVLAQEHKLALESRLEVYVSELRNREVGQATVTHLLNHSAGLPGWRPLYEAIWERDGGRGDVLGGEAAKQHVLEQIADEPLEHHVGTAAVYSDLGFILLGVLIERISGMSLDDYCREMYDRLGAHDLGFRPAAGSPFSGQADASSIAPTEYDPRRNRLLCGEVHDDNAYAVGGVAGHAGLFGTTEAVLAVTGAWLHAYLGGAGFLHSSLVRRFWTKPDIVPMSSWALGWDTPSGRSSSGRWFSSASFGHLGFTGTSIWIDATRRLEVVLLSNRVYPTRTNTRIQQFRPLIHDAVVESVVGESAVGRGEAHASG